jgi:hypothetical protein
MIAVLFQALNSIHLHTRPEMDKTTYGSSSSIIAHFFHTNNASKKIILNYIFTHLWSSMKMATRPKGKVKRWERTRKTTEKPETPRFLHFYNHRANVPAPNISICLTRHRHTPECCCWQSRGWEE